MLFNSLEFSIFLPSVFFLYWFVFKKNTRVQNLLLVISSYLFYGWWDYRFLSLILFSTIVDYFVGAKIHDCKSKIIKKFFLWISIVFNLGLLSFFKYFNFFIESWIDFISFFGYELESTWTINVILPVGISFYTFQTMSYSLDIYFGKLKPTRDFISFATFVSFFPQLVAGPIERASSLLPQVLQKRKFNYEKGVQGLRLILYGMFKKVVIADSLAPHIDYIFNNYYDLGGGVLLLGLIYFSIQIYCDFSGYSDIAIGISKLFGFELMSNFRFPYFSKNVGEFWKRWHISLSSWFRDYVYIPLGGSKKSRYITIRNVFIVFIISGFWHGANITFIMWGLVHGLLYVPSLIMNKKRRHKSANKINALTFSPFKDIFRILTTYFSIVITWVFFRSDSISISLNYLYNLISNFKYPTEHRTGLFYVLIIIPLDYSMKFNERNPISYKNPIMRWSAYILLGYLIITHFKLIESSNFIYFQF